MVVHKIARYGRFFRGVWVLNGKVILVCVDKRISAAAALRDSYLATNY